MHRKLENEIEGLREQIKQKDTRLQSLEEFQRDTLERIHELAEWTREIKGFRNEILSTRQH